MSDRQWRPRGYPSGDNPNPSANELKNRASKHKDRLAFGRSCRWIPADNWLGDKDCNPRQKNRAALRGLARQVRRARQAERRMERGALTR